MTVTGQYLGIVTGSVIFKSGANALGSVTLVNGQASLNTSFRTSGSRYITATYVGDLNNAGSKSLALQQLVNKGVEQHIGSFRQQSVRLRTTGDIHRYGSLQRHPD